MKLVYTMDVILLKLALLLCLQCCFDISGVSAQCPPSTCPLLRSGLNDTDRKAILDQHNQYRANIANGLVGDFPQASNMIEMTWDTELENMAQTWATGCKYKHAPKKCKKSSTFKAIGENTGKIVYSGPPNGPNWHEIVKRWYDENINYPPSDVDSFIRKATPGKKTGHFTQVVWALSYRLGCGFTEYMNTGSDAQEYPYEQFYVCNYAPRGNYDTEPIYMQGTPCTECNSKAGGYFSDETNDSNQSSSSDEVTTTAQSETINPQCGSIPGLCPPK